MFFGFRASWGYTAPAADPVSRAAGRMSFEFNGNVAVSHPSAWMEVRPEGLYCSAADIYVDPVMPVPRAIVTHGHADHARAGHGRVYATPETLEIMRCRFGEDHCDESVPLAYTQTISLGDKTELMLAPAGHILGSAQAVIEHADSRIVVSGDYKRREDPTCEPFVPVRCDVFVTEATFGLPVFRHPPIRDELAKLLASLEQFPERCHLVGTYALGKCQRVMLELRALGYEKPVYLHGALVKLCELYEAQGVALGEWKKVSDVDDVSTLAGEIVLAPPSAIADRWSRRFPDVLSGMASGWMQIRARARQRRAELPLIVSDHCDWSELLETIEDVGAPEIWVTHGREEALVHQATKMGYNARALSLLGYDEEETG